MICILIFYKRKPELTHEQFLDYWKNVHSPLAMSTPAIGKYIKRYVQHHIRPVAMFPGVEPLEFDGFSEGWVENIEDLQAMFEEPKFQEVILPDEANLLDTSATRIIMIDEPHVIKG